MKKPILATILITLLNTAPAFAQNPQSPLLITSHTIKLEQHLYGEGKERKNFYYSVEETIQIKNTSETIFKGPLKIWVGGAEELQIEINDKNIQNPESEKEEQVFKINENILEIRLDEDTYIQPGTPTKVNVEYRYFLIFQGKEALWTRKILYPHKAQSLEFTFNTNESAGFFPKSENIAFKKSKKYGHSAMNISPEVKDLYKITTMKKTSEDISETPIPTTATTAEKKQHNELTGEPAKIRNTQYPKSSGANFLLVSLVGLNLALLITIIIIVLKNTDSTD